MNSHILSGAVGALLALVGSTAVDNLKCNQIEARSIVLTDGETSVSISPTLITLENKRSGAACALTPESFTLLKRESNDRGGATIRFSPETGAALSLLHKEAVVSLVASSGTKAEAALRTSFAENWASAVASPDSAVFGVVDRGRSSLMTGEQCVFDLPPDATGAVPPGASLDLQSLQTVFVTRTGDKYHLAGCQHLRKSMIPMELSEALKRFTPCRACTPGGN